MKVLLLSVVLLFLTGTQGRSFWQSDKPEDTEKALQKIFQDAITIITDVVKNMEYSEIAKQYKIKEKVQIAIDSKIELESVIEDYVDVIWKKWDDQFHEKFPVIKKKFVPILEDFDDKIEEQLVTIAKQIVPVGSELFLAISKQVKSFLESLEPIAQKGRDKMLQLVDSLRVKLQPYVADVRAEYDKYSKQVAQGLDGKAKQWKQLVEKKMDEIRENSKPYIENLKNRGVAHVEEIRQKVEKLLKEFLVAKEQQEQKF